jgi:hypothetical protein
VKTQLKIPTNNDTLCQLHKCDASLEIKEKVRESGELLEKKIMFHSRKINLWGNK